MIITMAIKYNVINQAVKDNEEVPNEPNFCYCYQLAEYKHLRFYVRVKVNKSNNVVSSRSFSFELNPKRWEYVWKDFIEDEFKFKQK